MSYITDVKRVIYLFSHIVRILSIYFILAKIIFILGPPAVGRNELKRRLMAYAPNRFEEVVPCKQDNFLNP